MTATKIWKVGASSKTLGMEQIEYIHVDENFPAGRYTTDRQQAEQWAQQLCDEINQDPRSGASDYEPVWLDDLPQQE